TPAKAALLEPLDDRVEGERQEDGDEEPGQNLSRDPDDLEHRGDREHDPDDDEDRPRPEPDHTFRDGRLLRDHGGSIAARPDDARPRAACECATLGSTESDRAGAPMERGHEERNRTSGAT